MHMRNIQLGFSALSLTLLTKHFKETLQHERENSNKIGNKTETMIKNEPKD